MYKINLLVRSPYETYDKRKVEMVKSIKQWVVDIIKRGKKNNKVFQTKG